MLEYASRLPFGSLSLGLDPHSSMQLVLRHRRREESATALGIGNGSGRNVMRWPEFRWPDFG